MAYIIGNTIINGNLLLSKHSSCLIALIVTTICLPTHKIFCVKILCKYATSSKRYKHFSEDMQIVIQ